MKQFRPTAIPLVTVDPYFSLWSFSDKLYDDATRHWTGKRGAMTGFLKVDERYYRFMGKIQSNNEYYFCEPDVIEQTGVRISATKTEYTFENDLMLMRLSFRTPLLTDDLYLMSRPISYISYEISFKDGKKHNAEVYFDICSELCVENTSDEVSFTTTEHSICCGKGERDMLKNSGDEIRIDWGNLHLIAPGAEYKAVTGFDKRDLFKYGNKMNGITEPRRVCEDFPSISAVREYKDTDRINGFICIGFEDFCSIEFFGEKLKGYWTENGDSFDDVIKKAISEYDVINKRCDEFDKALYDRAARISEKYADIITLVYRQVIGAHKLTKHNGKLLFFSKECYSDGDIATVDVTYPSMPMFLLLNPDLLEGMLNPIFEYAEGDHDWSFEFAPHDVGLYPKANRQDYGRNRQTHELDPGWQMPIEECGNMLLCTAALCRARNDYSYAAEHIEVLRQWADYLVNKGYDPEYQLCTDDFAGHLAHNCNLAVKGILGIAAFAMILEKCGKDGAKYREKAKAYAAQWKENAASDGNYALVFDKKDTWSLKYNLVMDRLLELDIFDKDIFRAETDFYKTKMNKYGIPLDSRADYTKSDWQMWTACLTDDTEYRDMIIDAMWEMICDMRERVPFSDWYYTSSPNMERFQNRTVQGGLFMPLLF